MGFVFLNTYLPWYRLTGDPALLARTGPEFVAAVPALAVAALLLVGREHEPRSAERPGQLTSTRGSDRPAPPPG